MSRKPTATGESTKLQKCYGEPLEIVGIEPSDTYRVRRLNRSERAFETTAHVSQLKIWTGNQTSDTESDSGEEKEKDREINSDGSVKVENLDLSRENQKECKSLNKNKKTAKLNQRAENAER